MLQAVLDPSKAPVYEAYTGPTELDDAMLLCIIGNAEGRRMMTVPPTTTITAMVTAAG
jgi:hypothetical protein